MSVFAVILVCIFPHLFWIRKDTEHPSYSVQIWEKTDQYNSEYGHFSGSGKKSDSFRNSETVKRISQILTFMESVKIFLRTPRFTKMVKVFPKFMKTVKLYSQIPNLWKSFSWIPKFMETVKLFSRISKFMRTVKIFSWIWIVYMGFHTYGRKSFLLFLKIIWRQTLIKY